MQSRVRRVNLKIGIAHSERSEAGRLRRTTEEAFLPALLTACEARLHEHFGAETLILVRKLSVRWSLERERLGEAVWARQLGRELADTLAAQLSRVPASERVSPPDGVQWVLLDGPAHWDALCLTREVQGAALPWFLERAPEGRDPWERACAAGPSGLRSLLAQLERIDSIERVLRALPLAALRRALTCLALESWPGRARQVLHVRLGFVAQPTPSASPAPESGGRVASMASGAESRPLPSTPSDVPPSRASSASTPRDPVGSSAAPPAAVTGTPEPAPSDRAAPAPTSSRPPAAGQPRGDSFEDPLSSPEPRSPISSLTELTRGGVPLETAPALLAISTPEPTDPDLGRDVLATRYAGLFYLTRLLLQLELAEHLWCAGIPEGAFLHELARWLLDSDAETDPAPGLFARRGELREIPDWAREEVRAKSLDSLRGWLAARHVDAALLPSPDELANEWASTRLPPGIHDSAARLLLLAAAVLTVAFCGSLGGPVTYAELMRHLRVDGTLVCHEELTIRLSMSAIDLQLRRAGLDIDPGYAPWLGCRIRILFQGSDAD